MGTRPQEAGLHPALLERVEGVIGGGDDELAVDGHLGDLVVGMRQDGGDRALDDRP